MDEQANKWMDKQQTRTNKRTKRLLTRRVCWLVRDLLCIHILAATDAIARKWGRRRRRRGKRRSRRDVWLHEGVQKV